MLTELAPWFGYLASLLLALALLVNNDIKFRWLTTGGNIAFIIYGLVIGAMPIILTNSILLSINLFSLYRIYNRKEHFELLEFSDGGVMIDRFLAFYHKDISKYFPAFERNHLKGKLNFVVLRDLVIANIFSVKLQEEGVAEVIINYTVPKYRDYKVGRFIFDKEKEYLREKGVRSVCYTSIVEARHRKFLTVMKFSEKKVNETSWLCREL